MQNEIIFKRLYCSTFSAYITFLKINMKKTKHILQFKYYIIVLFFSATDGNCLPLKYHKIKA